MLDRGRGSVRLLGSTINSFVILTPSHMFLNNWLSKNIDVLNSKSIFTIKSLVTRHVPELFVDNSRKKVER